MRPYRQRYAARSLPKLPQTATPPISTTLVAFRDPIGLFGPLPDQAGPLKDRLRSNSCRPKLALPGQYTLQLDYCPNVIDLMLRLGSTHAEIGRAVGLSRPQITNVINGRFGASRRVVRRVLELATAA